MMKCYLLKEIDYLNSNFKNIITSNKKEEPANNMINWKENYSEEFLYESELDYKHLNKYENKSNLSETVIKSESKVQLKTWKLSTSLLSICFNMFNSNLINKMQRRKFKIMIIKNEDYFKDIIKEYENNGNKEKLYDDIKNILVI